MKRAFLEAMSEGELRSLASLSGIPGAEDAAPDTLMDAILADANRTAEIAVAGMTFKVDVRNLRHASLVELSAKPEKTFADLQAMATAIVGEKQEKRIAQAASDGGDIDTIVYSFLISEIAKQVQAKNL
jgi:UDP-N-acetyl-D-mannosaminuronate dehydrogenase